LKEGIKEELEVKRNEGWTERKVYGLPSFFSCELYEIKFCRSRNNGAGKSSH
jgi:hypothetical protein